MSVRSLALRKPIASGYTFRMTVRTRVAGHARVKLSNIDPCRWGNPRRMTARQKAALKEGIEEIGMAEPIVVWRPEDKPDRFEVVNGHHRLEVLRESGEAEADVTMLDVSQDEARILAVSLNLQGDFDVDALDRYVRDLVKDGVADLGDVSRLTAFTAAEVKAMSELGTDFLDAAIGDGQYTHWSKMNDRPDPVQGAPDPNAEQPQHVSLHGRLGIPFSVFLTPEQREIVLRAVNHAKTSSGAEGSSEALARICAVYCEAKGLEVAAQPAAAEAAQ